MNQVQSSPLLFSKALFFMQNIFLQKWSQIRTKSTTLPVGDIFDFFLILSLKKYFPQIHSTIINDRNPL